MTGVLTIFVNDVAALSFFSFAPSFVLPSIRGMTALTRQFDHFYEGSNSQGNNKYTFHKLNGQTFQIFPMSLMCHVPCVICFLLADQIFLSRPGADTNCSKELTTQQWLQLMSEVPCPVGLSLEVLVFLIYFSNLISEILPMPDDIFILFPGRGRAA